MFNVCFVKKKKMGACISTTNFKKRNKTIPVYHLIHIEPPYGNQVDNNNEDQYEENQEKQQQPVDDKKNSYLLLNDNYIKKKRSKSFDFIQVLLMSSNINN